MTDKKLEIGCCNCCPHFDRVEHICQEKRDILAYHKDKKNVKDKFCGEENKIENNPSIYEIPDDCPLEDAEMKT